MSILSSIAKAILPAATALIPGVGPILAPIVAGASSAFSEQQASDQSQSRVREAYGVSQASADKQMAFQERMSSTGYQRSMADMYKAGLNPMLAYSQGPASTPGGASATMGASQAVAAGAEGISSARETKTALAQNRQTGQTTKLLNAQTAGAKHSARIRKSEVERAETDARWYGSPEGQRYEIMRRKIEAVGLPAATALGIFKHQNIIKNSLGDIWDPNANRDWEKFVKPGKHVPKKSTKRKIWDWERFSKDNSRLNR